MTGTTMRAAALRSFGAVLIGAVLLGGAAARASDEVDFETFDRLLKVRGPACVTIKYVLKVKGAQGEFEDERESSGVMIEADGLVLTANSQLGGGPFVRAGVSAVPTNIKVLIGDDTQGIDARVVARDTELDLSWLKLKDIGDRKFVFVDLSKAAAGRLGERLYTFMRLGKFFDRALTIRETRIGGTTKKPRSLYIPSPAVGGLGLPMFNAAGEIVAFTVMQLPDAEELEAATSMTAYTGGNGILLPAAEVAKATARAKEADTGEDAAAESELAEGEASTKPAESQPAEKKGE
ncbi:MAG: hypothetical protein AMXMBFR47_42730 [Planctomycetota bacterium]